MKKILLGISLVSSFCLADLPYSGTTMYKEFIKIDAAIDSDFTAAETEFLQEAVDLLQSRLLLHRVEACTLDNERLANPDYKYLEKMGWPNTKIARTHALGFQLAFFRRNPSGKPLKIDILAFHEKEGAYAQAKSATVETRFLEGQVGEVSGDFSIEINRWQLLANTDNGKNLSFWAATIAHEMLHNLGHDHDNTDYDGNEIIVFDKCIETNGYLNTESGSGTKEKITVNPKTGKKIVRKPEVCKKAPKKR